MFGGALGVGIGLGLQKLAANYIAGFTILLDKSIRLGDMITVDGRQGRVSNVTSRYVVLRSLDGIEAIVPNETLVTTTVLNHSHASHDIRVSTAVRIVYGSDVEARSASWRTRRAPSRGSWRHPSRRPPSSTRSERTASTSSSCCGSRDRKSACRAFAAAVNRRILAAFAAAGIEIPPPRRLVVIDRDEAPAPRDTRDPPTRNLPPP